MQYGRLSDNDEPMRLSIALPSGRSFDIDEQKSCLGNDVKQRLTEQMRDEKVTMSDGSDYRVSAIRLLYGDREISDHLPISTAICDTSALLSLLIRPPECEQFLLQPDSHLRYLRDEDPEEYAKVRDDKECVLTAVKRSPSDLLYASDELRNDKTIVLAAVEIDGSALEHASEELQDNIDVVVAAVMTRKKCLRFASSRLKNIPELIVIEDASIKFNTSFGIPFLWLATFRKWCVRLCATY